jgi:DNA-binding GntR family transcriptional regulator
MKAAPELSGEAEKGSISESAYQLLRSRIFGGELAPGTLLTERRLADDLGASRTPLRAAIKRLEGERLIERAGAGGFVVRQVSVDELLEILSIRRLLEGEAAALAAERMPADVIERLVVASRAIVAEPDITLDEYWAYDDVFHRELANGGGKPLLARLITELRRQARMCHVKTMDRRFDAQAAEHLLVLEAIARHQPADARQAMEEHEDRVKERLLTWLAR